MLLSFYFNIHHLHTNTYVKLTANSDRLHANKKKIEFIEKK